MTPMVGAAVVHQMAQKASLAGEAVVPRSLGEQHGRDDRMMESELEISVVEVEARRPVPE